MAQIDARMVRELREQTKAGVMECKRALEQCEGDLKRAAEILREQGLAKAEQKQGREARHGLVEAYVHAGGRIGVLVEVNCETDFVARTDQFKALAHDIALQIAAAGPKYIAPDDKPVDDESDPSDVSLLAQPFIKDPSQTIQQLIVNNIAQLGENIRVRRFARFELGA
ncbi:MAG: translation elongation factor Ts [Bacteroidetes bacterium]|nr:translation elongation factor Ts [Bacteroidota bacterium]MCL5026501.1 translation elongation factor Ts [Chloroflexota bacterium]